VLSPELEIQKVWVLAENEGRAGKRGKPERALIHGFAILKDGSMIFTFDGGHSIQRVDRCGRPIWSTPGAFNHTVSAEDDGRFVWTLQGELQNVEVDRLAVATGKLVRRIRVADIVAANPSIDILEVGKDDEWNEANPGNATEKWMHDPFHFNDVEPLPAAIAARFAGFGAGDLLLSSRTLNLLFVMDPATLQVKWWQTGSWREQHDPDWQPTGEISVFDNRRGRGYSRIVGIDPGSRDVRVLFDGRVNGFYSPIRGKHQMTESGDILVTSPQQGRVFEVDGSGRTVLEVINTKPHSSEFNYLISEAIWLPLGTFDFAKEFSCEK
jgi:Arylsulfotransferase (ASST)